MFAHFMAAIIPSTAVVYLTQGWLSSMIASVPQFPTTF